MTNTSTTALFTSLLNGVRRHNSTIGCLLYEDEVLAALSRALDPAIAERAGDVLEGVSDAPWRVGHLESYEMSGLAFRRVYFPTASEGEIREAHIRGEDCDENARFIAWCREGVPALLAQNAALRAERDSAIRGRDSWRDDYKALSAAIVGDTGLSAMTVATQARLFQLRAEAAEAERDALRAERDEYKRLAAAGELAAKECRIWQGQAEAAESKVEKLLGAVKTVLHDIDELVANSEGVAGLHMNGAVAEWSSLMDGGAFGAWLSSVEVLRAALSATATTEEGK